MKRKVLVIVLLSVSLIACRKTDCYLCTIKNIVQNGIGSKPVVATTTTETICNATAKDIDGYISANSKTSASGSGSGYTLNLTNIYCDKQ